MGLFKPRPSRALFPVGGQASGRMVNGDTGRKTSDMENYRCTQHKYIVPPQQYLT